jgi:hypothetical protein
MKSHHLISLALVSFIVLSFAHIGWVEGIAGMRSAGVSLSEGEVVTDGKVTCGLIKGQFSARVIG